MNKRLSKKILRAVMPAYNRTAFLFKTDQAVKNMNAYSTQQIGRAIDVNGRVYLREEAAALARRDTRDDRAGRALGYMRWGKWDPYRNWRLRFAQERTLQKLAHELRDETPKDTINLSAWRDEDLVNALLYESSLRLLGR